MRHDAGGAVLETAERPEASEYQEIKPEGAADYETCKAFWDSLLEAPHEAAASEKEAAEGEKPEADLEELLDAYFEDLKEKSDCPETIPERPFEASDLEKVPPEEKAKRREEFEDVKGDLKKQWEQEHGRPWPKYDHDVRSAGGKIIRKAGDDYDAHHIQPLGMGGKNEAKNITPLDAEVHYDHQGVHAPDSPYGKLKNTLGGADA